MIYCKIRCALENRAKLNDHYFMRTEHPDEITLLQFLGALGIDQQTYIDAIRTSILRTTVFLKRKSTEIMTNNYNEKIIIRHRANMDIQFITDPHGLVIYLTSYMMKANHKMSKILNIAADEIEKGHKTLP